MDYVVGSVAALISGNVTPSRPKLIKRALTPKKHQLSPNITPKSEVEDRSIFLSPTLQKKKSLVKKSPKRIFENPDLDATTDGEGNTSLISPKADKVKKHLKDDLEADSLTTHSPKALKKSKEKHSVLLEADSLGKKLVSENVIDIKVGNESTPKKKKKNLKTMTPQASAQQKDDKELLEGDAVESLVINTEKSPKKKRKSDINIDNVNIVTEATNNEQQSPKKKKKKIQSESVIPPQLEEEYSVTEKVEISKLKNIKKLKKKNKKKAKVNNEIEKEETGGTVKKSKKGKKSHVVNPNAITQEDSDSEHESDDNLESDNELNNKKVLDAEPEASSDDDEEQKVKVKKPEKKEEHTEADAAEEARRTLFVGNVPFSAKCKKEVKNIFSKYGHIETVRIRTVPVKDARVTPKLAVIKNELHPERSTVNIYVKFQDPDSVEKALVENNKVLNNCHLRVTRSDVSGQYDQRRAVFVGNLPFAIEDETLRAKFEKCGDIESIRIVRDKKTNAGKGFGYVNFASIDGVELALGMTEEDLTIKNRILRVKRCTMTQKNDKRNRGQGQNLGQNRPNNQGQNRVNSQGHNRFNQGQKRPFNQGQTRPFNQGQKRPFSQGQKRPFNQGQNRPFNQGQNRPYNQRQFRPNQASLNQDNSTGRPQPEGAYRRLMNERPNEEKSDGPVVKKQRKEFVGLTADKKKKHKFNKGQKKKRALSEILTK